MAQPARRAPASGLYITTVSSLTAAGCVPARRQSPARDRDARTPTASDRVAGGRSGAGSAAAAGSPGIPGDVDVPSGAAVAGSPLGAGPLGAGSGPGGGSGAAAAGGARSVSESISRHSPPNS